MKHWMFSCHDVSQMISRSMDVRLPLRHRLAVRMHLLMCRYCSLFRHQLNMLRKMSRTIDDGQTIPTSTHTSNHTSTDKLSDEARARIKETIRSRL